MLSRVYFDYLLGEMNSALLAVGSGSMACTAERRTFLVMTTSAMVIGHMAEDLVHIA